MTAEETAGPKKGEALHPFARRAMRNRRRDHAIAAAVRRRMVQTTKIEAPAEDEIVETVVLTTEYVNSYCLMAEDSGSGVTSLTPQMDGDALPVPVLQSMTAKDVAISWLSDNVPAGDWTATLQRRPKGAAAFADVATFTVAIS